MLTIEKIVRILKEEDYLQLKSSLESTRGQKFSELLSHYRKGEPEDNFHEKLNVSKNAFNVLKSRLYEKLQKHLINSGDVNSDSLFLQAINIPDLIYKMDRDLAITLLDGLEKEFKERDLPEYLVVIHGAQKRLFFNTSRYYHYSRLYNRNVAYQLALNKVEEEFFGYNQSLIKFFITGNKEHFENLFKFQKEIDNLTRLNNSPRFKLFQNLVKASLATHFPDLIEHYDSDTPISKLLEQAKEIVKLLEGNVFTGHYLKAIDSLQFLYYCRIGLYHNASEFLNNSVNDSMELISYSNLICLRPYLEQRLIYSIRKKEKAVIFPIGIDSIEGIETEDALPYISIMKYNALAHMVNGDLIQAHQTIKTLYNNISFKGLPALEVEIKCLFLILSLTLNKEVSTDAILTSISRKIRDTDFDAKEKDTANQLVKVIRMKSNGILKRGDGKSEDALEAAHANRSVHFYSLQKALMCVAFKDQFLN